MKKKNLLRLISFSMIGLTTVAAATGAIAWFTPYVHVDNTIATDNNINGETLGAYFAYGNGIPYTEGHPENSIYGITKPRHLYNLAWLQYLGYFDRTDSSKSDYATQYYFELAADLDMTGWVLPPIGTDEHPFIGNFNGNGHVISNLTVSNDFSEYNTHPSAINGWGDTSNFQPHIVGLFGVIGNYSNKYDTSAGTCNFVSSNNEFKNTGITSLTINTATQQTLVGMVAGYVGGTLSNIAIDASTINVTQSNSASYGGHTTKLSDFGVVGYAESQFKRSITKVDTDIYDVNVVKTMIVEGNEQLIEFNASDSGDTTGWGGSVNMMAMYQRLLYIKSNAASTVNSFAFNVSQNYLGYDSEGNPIKNGSETTNYTSSSSSRYTSSSLGNFNYGTGRSDSYMYMLGGHYERSSIYDYYTHEGYYITDGTNYLKFTGSGFTNTTDPSDATLWVYTVYSGSTYYIKTTYNGTDYYLYNDSNSLSYSTSYNSNSRRWTVSESNGKQSIANGNYHIYYENGWKLVDFSTLGSPYKISYNGTYLVFDSSSTHLGATTNSNQASAFEVEDSYITYTSNGTKYYLYGIYYDENGGDGAGYYYGASFMEYDSSWSSYLATKNNNQIILFVYQGTNYYMRYSNSQWTYYRYSTSLTFTGTGTRTDVVNAKGEYIDDRVGPDNHLVESVNGIKYTSTDTTYFPLNVTKDGTTTNTTQMLTDYSPKDTNTGYVIAGSNLDNTNSFGPLVSSIRVSAYGKDATYTENNRTYQSNIKNSFTGTESTYASGEFTTIKTINSSGVVTINSAMEQSYSKYTDSKSSLRTVLRSSPNNYGLHFVSGSGVAVSKNNIVKAGSVSILGETKTNYEMPVNSIDFNLKEKGYINFFAGTYYSATVDSFFSLYHILRNSDDTISSLKEISEIYANDSKNNYSYIYVYKDGTFSKPYRIASGNKKYEMSSNDEGTILYDPTLLSNYEMSVTNDLSTYTSNYGYSSVFNTNWISNSDGTLPLSSWQCYLFYFEIPMNSGEFCLGSVSGRNGGYLLYLDIGANAMKVQRTIFYEYFSHTTKTYTYPLGVAVLDGGTYGNSGVDPLDTACIVITAGFKGTAGLDRTGTNDLTVTRTNTTNAKIGYSIDDITRFHDPGGTDLLSSDFTSDSSTVVQTRRMQYIDYNVQLSEYIRTVIVDTKTDNGSWTRTSVKQYLEDGSEVEAENIKIYDHENNGIKITDTNGDGLYTQDIILDSNDYSSTKKISFRVVLKQGVTATETINLNVDIDDYIQSGTYYVFDNYTITFSVTGEAVTVVVKEYTSGRTIIIQTTTVSAVGDEIVINLPS